MGVQIGIIQGRVTTRQESFDKLEPLSVPAMSASKTINVGTKSGELTRILVRRTAGTSGGNFTVQVFDAADLNLDSMLFEATSEGQDRMDMIRSELGRFNSSTSELYVRVSTVSAGHSFQIRLQGNKTRI